MDLGEEALGVLPLALCELLCDSLAQAASLDEALGVINRVRESMLGKGMLTINVDATAPTDPPDEIQLMRIWSSEPKAYPVGGRKRKTRTPWTRQLFEHARVFTGEGDAVLVEVFDDHARIAALGLHSVVNVPLLLQNRSVATVNVLGCRTGWSRCEIAQIRLLALLAQPYVLREILFAKGT